MLIDKKLIEFREELHKNPELSGSEEDTSNRIIDYISQYNPDKIVRNIGGYGVAFIFDSNRKGPTVLFRSELDALPIQEINNFGYKSEKNNVSHCCGHDGHMTILAGLGFFISKNPPSKGKIVLLFQPAEETGQGANLVLEDEKFNEIKPDYVFALHNLPGYKKHTILIRNNIFSSASKGMIIKLNGKTSHAGEPEKGINPALAVSKILDRLINLPQLKMLFRDFVLLTIVHVSLGEIAFGTSPGYGEIRATLRAYQNRDIDILWFEAANLVTNIAKEENLKFEISHTEEFLALVNNRESVKLIKQAAKKIKFEIQRIPIPFRWSDDFSRFTNNYTGAMFGIGSGLNCPKLHNPDYDFPDEIIETGIKMFLSIYNQILNNS